MYKVVTKHEIMLRENMAKFKKSGLECSEMLLLNESSKKMNSFTGTKVIYYAFHGCLPKELLAIWRSNGYEFNTICWLCSCLDQPVNFLWNFNNFKKHLQRQVLAYVIIHKGCLFYQALYSEFVRWSTKRLFYWPQIWRAIGTNNRYWLQCPVGVLWVDNSKSLSEV